MRALIIAKKTKHYREWRPELLSPNPLDAWSEDGDLGFVAFAVRPPDMSKRNDLGEYWGGILTFVVEIQRGEAVSIRLARIDGHGTIASTRALHEDPKLPSLFVGPASSTR